MRRRQLAARALTAAALVVAAVVTAASRNPPQRTLADDEAARASPGAVRGTLAGALDLAAYLPSTTVAFVAVPNVRSFVARAGATGVARIVESREFEPIRRSVAARLPAGLAAAGGAVAVLWGTLAPALGSGAALGVTRFGSSTALEAVVVADVNADERAARAFAGSLEMLALTVGQLESHAVRDVELAVLRADGREVAAWVVARGLLVAGTSTSIVERALRLAAAVRPVGVSALSDDASFCAAVAALGPGGQDDACEYLAYCDLSRAFDELGVASAVSAYLGACGPAAVAGRIDRSVREEMYVACACADSAVLAPFVGARSTGSLAGSLAGETLVAAIGSADADVLARRLSAGQPGAASDRRIARVYGALPGILSGPVASLAGGGAGEFACGLWSATRVNWFPMLGGALEAVDDARASRAAAEIVSSLAAATGGRTMRYRVGATASSEAAGVAYVDGPRVRAPLVTSPACGSIARTLLCTGDARGVRELVRGRARSFARSACYRDVAARLRAPRGLLVVADLPAIVDRAFEPYARLAIARIFAGARVERAELPPGAFVGRHLEAVGASFMVEPDAIRVSSVTPAGLALTVGACAYLVESVMGGGDAAPSRPLPPSPPPPAREEAAGQDEF